MDIGLFIDDWAKRSRDVSALALIGSRARRLDPLTGPDEYSDWDYHLVTDRPELFASSDWLQREGVKPAIYVQRAGRLRTARKITIVTPQRIVADLMVLPRREYSRYAWLLRIGIASRFPATWHSLRALATVIRDGYEFRCGGDGWRRFYRTVATTVPPLRRSDAEICAMATEWIVDFVSAQQKFARGEYVAAQRWIHHHLLEVNLQLLHELRLRHGQPTMPDGRRIERLSGQDIADTLMVTIREWPVDLGRVLDQCAKTFRYLVSELVGNAWQWPEFEQSARRRSVDQPVSFG